MSGLDQLVYANVASKLTRSRGYGVAGCSEGWPEASVCNDDSGGLEKLVSYGTQAPRSVVVQQLPIGSVLVVRDPDDRDPGGRRSYRVHAVLDRSGVAHPRDLVAASRGLDSSSLNGQSVATHGNLPTVTLHAAEAPVYLPADPLVLEIAAHLIRNRQDSTRTCLAVGQCDADDLLTAVESALWLLPRDLTGDVRFSTWQAKPAQTGNPYGSRMPPLDVVGFTVGTEITGMPIAAAPFGREPIRDEFYCLAEALDALAEQSRFVADEVDSVERLHWWVEDRRFLLDDPARLEADRARWALLSPDLSEVWSEYRWCARIVELVDSGELALQDDAAALPENAREALIRAMTTDLVPGRSGPRVALLRSLGWQEPEVPAQPHGRTSSWGGDDSAGAASEFPRPPSAVVQDHPRTDGLFEQLVTDATYTSVSSSELDVYVRNLASEWRSNPSSGARSIERALGDPRIDRQHVSSIVRRLATVDLETALLVVLSLSFGGAADLVDVVRAQMSPDFLDRLDRFARPGGTRRGFFRWLFGG